MENQEKLVEEKEKNCEILDSWEVLKTQEADEVEEPQKNSSEIIHQSEDSDGISVISESELCKTMSESEMDKGEETATDEEKMEVAEEFSLPLTPPATPITEVEENVEAEQCFIHNNPRNFMFLAGLFVIVAVLYSHINSLKNDIQNCDQRIQKLEEENQMLKTTLEQLKKSSEAVVNPEIEFLIDEKSPQEVNEEFTPNEPRLASLYEEETLKLPPTKTVWLGSETEHKVEILDKKHELPDYCFHTEEDDLFFEYNQEICEQKRRKLAKEQKRKPLKRQWNVDSYDEFIQETLKSLDDEIQEIKRKRTKTNEKPEEKSQNSPKKKKKSSKTPEYLKNSPENLNNVQYDLKSSHGKPQFSPSESFSEKSSKPKRKKPKRKDRNWLEDRTNGREEARKNHEKEKENEENWFLKRKNERELDRLQS